MHTGHTLCTRTIFVMSQSKRIGQSAIKATKSEKKANRKIVKKLSSLLKEEKDLEVSRVPTRILFVGNGGLLCGIDRISLLKLFQIFGPIRHLDMFPKRAYSLVTFSDVNSASDAYSSLHGRKLDYPGEFYKKDQVFYLAYLCSIPERLISDQSKLPSAIVRRLDCGKLIAPSSTPIKGLHLYDSAISEEEEVALLKLFTENYQYSQPSSSAIEKLTEKTANMKDDSDLESPALVHNSLKHRMVKHYGYAFNYDTNNVDKDSPLPQKIPELLMPILQRMQVAGYFDFQPDQLTVNEYRPGQGIPPHIDTHSAFEDGIISLSLAGQIVMDFRHPDGTRFPLYLPPRSLLVMNGESRYLWSHGITPRKYDIISEDSETGTTTLQERGVRISLTFRKVRRTPCTCKYSTTCDSQGFKSNTERMSDSQIMETEVQTPLTATEADSLENKHVHEVYETIAEHFSGTRHSPWPKIAKFLQNLPAGSFVADVGCGNGKYMGVNSRLHMFGSDRSFNLSLICRERGYSIITSDILQLPYRNNAFDASICIAVIHHLSTKERRLDAVKELMRITKNGGLVLISVWALEQDHNDLLSEIGKEKFGNVRMQNEQTAESKTLEEKKTIVINKQRNKFEQQDLFVPWHFSKANKNTANEASTPSSVNNDPVYQRFYHVFKKGELEHLCQTLCNVKVIESYFDKGNWCVILKKCLL